MDSATGTICLGDPRVDRHHHIIRNTHSIFPSSWSHALLPSFHRSTQFVWFIMAGFPFISSHPLPTLLKPEPLFLKNSLRMPCEVRRSVDDGLSAFDLHCCTTLWSSELSDSLRCRGRVSVEAVIMRSWRPYMSEFRDWLGGGNPAHLKPVIERVWRYTWRLWSSEFGDAFGGHDRARLDEYFEAVNLEVIVWEWGVTGAETVFIG